eukprot:28545-Chlamydomonas_euryale.AAC.1
MKWGPPGRWLGGKLYEQTEKWGSRWKGGAGGKGWRGRAEEGARQRRGRGERWEGEGGGGGGKKGGL